MNRLPRWFVPSMAVVPAVVLVVFYAWPFATLLARGLSPDSIGDTIGDSLTWRVVWFTFWQAVVSTALTIAAGLVPAFVMARYEFPGRRLLDGMLASVFVLPTVVMGAAVLAILPDAVERGVVPILVAHVVFNLAVVVRTVGAVLATVPRDAEAAAATLGASPRRVFREITLPAITPALGAAASIIFVFTFTSFGVIRMLGGVRQSTVEVEIWRQATQFGNIGKAATLTVLQLVVVAAVVSVSAALQRRRSRSLGLRVRSERRRPVNTGQRRLVVAVALATAVAVVAPLAALVERSLRTRDGYSLNAWRNLGATEVRSGTGISTGIDPLASLQVSLQAMVVATVIAVIVGTLAAIAIAAAQRGGNLLDGAMMLPIATSAITVGFGILITFDHPPFDWRSSSWIVPVGHALVAVPFVVRTVLPVLRGVDRLRLEAAATLGATPVRAWRAIVAPHLRRPMTVAAGLAAAISLGEFGATSFLSRSGRETMPIAIERLLGRTGTLLQAQGYALAAILAAATITVVIAVDLAVQSGPVPRGMSGAPSTGRANVVDTRLATVATVPPR
jgi:thiamine transport system permease protein